ncbi:unnamed protein product, partial [Allacma fusca]
MMAGTSVDTLPQPEELFFRKFKVKSGLELESVTKRVPEPSPTIVEGLVVTLLNLLQKLWLCPYRFRFDAGENAYVCDSGFILKKIVPVLSLTLVILSHLGCAWKDAQSISDHTVLMMTKIQGIIYQGFSLSWYYVLFARSKEHCELLTLVHHIVTRIQKS